MSAKLGTKTVLLRCRDAFYYLLVPPTPTVSGSGENAVKQSDRIHVRKCDKISRSVLINIGTLKHTTILLYAYTYRCMKHTAILI